MEEPVEETVIKQKYVQVGFFSDVLNEVSDFFATYGWYCLFALCVILYIYYKIQPFIENYFKRKADDEYASKYHKDPDILGARLAAMEESRRKMQEKQIQLSEEYKVKLIQREEQKREEWLNRQVGKNACGTRLGDGKDDAKKTVKSDYSPLMGESSSQGRYRAPKRSSCGGGGCGKKD